MFKNFVGVDHVVIAVRDLDKGADTWRRLGFTLSPRGTHSAHLGSGNYTIMLDTDYIELLGVLTPTERNRRMVDFLARREGIDRIAFTATDAEAGTAELKAAGIAANGPMDFGRPVDLPGGGSTEAKFRTVHWPAEDRPGDVGIFACQHLTRDAVWIPALMKHSNTATRLHQVEILAHDPADAARRMGKLIDQAPVADSDDAVRLPSGNGRADMVFLTRQALTARHPGVVLDDLPDEGAACLSVGVADYTSAQQCIAASGVKAVVGPGRLAVAPSDATGIILELVAH